MSIAALSGAAPVAAPSAPAPKAPAPTSAPAQSRATAPDTVTISAAGQQAAKASGDMDHDGDSK